MIMFLEDRYKTLSESIEDDKEKELEKKHLESDKEHFKSIMDLVKKVYARDEEDLVTDTGDFFALVKEAILFAPIAVINPVVAVIGFMVNHWVRSKLTEEQKLKLLHRMDDQLKVVNEKIEDMKSNTALDKDEKEKKYALIKIKNTLERNIDIIKHSETV